MDRRHTFAGAPDAKTARNQITSSQMQDGARVRAFQREADNGTVHRYLMNLHPKALSLGKEEGPAAAGFQFRNKYEFGRGEA